jgi:hypothetical protein
MLGGTVMTHFTTEEWIDFANELVGIRKRKEMHRHLEGGCSRCRKVLSLWQKVRQTAKSATDCEPPERVVRIAKARSMGAQLERKLSHVTAPISIRRTVMKYKNALNLFAGILLAAVALSAVPSVHAQECSLAGVAGKWGYTYTGTIVLPTGGIPVAAVGRFTLDADGNLSGTQTRSNGGVSGEETISAEITVNADCTGSGNFKVYKSSGELVRTAVLALVFDDNSRELRGIFESLTLSTGPTLPVVITVEARKIGSLS